MRLESKRCLSSRSTRKRTTLRRATVKARAPRLCRPQRAAVRVLSFLCSPSTSLVERTHECTSARRATNLAGQNWRFDCLWKVRTCLLMHCLLFLDLLGHRQRIAAMSLIKLVPPIAAWLINYIALHSNCQALYSVLLRMPVLPK